MTPLIMMIVVQSVSALTALALVHHDWKHQTIPLHTLGIWLFITLCHAILCTFSTHHTLSIINHIGFSYDSCLALTGTAIFLWVYQWIRGKAMIGTADLIVLISFSAWIPVETIPLLLLISGSTALILTYYFKREAVPFLPGLFLAWLFTRLY